MRALHRDYHKWCFKCVLCDTTLVLGKQLDHDGEPYCKSCYNKAHAPKGYISGGHGPRVHCKTGGWGCVVK